MTPQEKIEFNKLKEEVKRLREAKDPAFLGALENNVLRPYVKLKENGTSTSAYTQTVDEDGTSVYSVAKPMTGFIELDGNLIAKYN